MKLTDEQKEVIKKCVQIVTELFQHMKKAFIQVYEQVKEFLNKKVSIKTKSFKKGNKYIHSYKYVELWKIFSYRKE